MYVSLAYVWDLLRMRRALLNTCTFFGTCAVHVAACVGLFCIRACSPAHVWDSSVNM